MRPVRFAAPVLLAFAIYLLPLGAGAQSVFDGRVSDSPVPASKGPDDEPSTDGGTFESSPLPSVLRPGEDDDAPLSTSEGEGTDGDETGGRFVRAPEGTEKPLDPMTPQRTGSPISPPKTDLQNGARLRQLDKMTGSIVTFDIGVGQTMEVERMRIHLDACRSPGDNDTHGTMAFLHIWDKKHPEAGDIFHGWMFAESPALSALDHPRYDLWVISCTIISGAASAGNE